MSADEARLEQFWSRVEPDGREVPAAGEELVNAVLADGEEAVLQFWSTLGRLVEHYADERGLGVSDGLVGEAVEAVLAGREYFKAALAPSGSERTHVGGEGLVFVEALRRRFQEQFASTLPELPPGMSLADGAWAFYVAQSLHGFPSAVVRAHDAAFGALEQSHEYRRALHAIGVHTVEIYGGVSHDPFSAERDSRDISGFEVRRRDGALRGSFVWPTAELMSANYDDAVTRVRLHVDRLARTYPGLPTSQELGVFDSLADNGAEDSGYFDERPRGFGRLLFSPMNTVGVHALRFAVERGGRQRWRGPLKVLASMSFFRVSWTRFCVIAILFGRRPVNLLSEVVGALRTTLGRAGADEEDCLAAAAVVEAWHLRTSARLH